MIYFRFSIYKICILVLIYIKLPMAEKVRFIHIFILHNVNNLHTLSLNDTKYLIL